jgi:hypothetical protein
MGCDRKDERLYHGGHGITAHGKRVEVLAPRDPSREPGHYAIGN